MPSIDQILAAEFGTNEIKELFFKVYTHPHIDGFIEPVRNFVESISPFAWGAMLGLVALVFILFGQKIIIAPVLLGSYVAAYAVGSTYIAPRLANFVESTLPFDIPIEIGVVGIILGVIAVLLCVPLYFLALGLGGGYVCYYFAYPIFESFLGHQTAMIISLAILVAVGVALVIFRKWAERVLTSVGGAYLFMLAVNEIVLLPAVANYVIWGVVAVVGIFVQIKTRRRY